jgi:hypothetical protein
MPRVKPDDDSAVTLGPQPRPMHMGSIFHYICVALAIGAIAFGMFGFYRGLSLPANEHRAPGKGDNWSV